MVELISIVVPLYNKEGHIGKTLDSILDQTYKEFEVLVVDDGSTDASADLVRSYTDHRIQLIQTSNQGVSSARNKGIESARGQWVAFLDADDWWAKDFLASMTEAMKAFPDHKIFASGRSRLFKDREERYEHDLLPADGTTARLNYYQVISDHLPLVNSSNSFINKELLVKYGCFRPGQRNHEDHDLWLRISQSQEVVFVNKNLSFYNKIDTQSASKGTFRANDFVTYLNTLNDVYDNLTNPERVWLRRYCKKFIPYSLLLNKSNYSKSEIRTIIGLSKSLLSAASKLKLSIIAALPAEKLYQFIKNRQR